MLSEGELLLAAVGITGPLRRGRLRITREALDEAQRIPRRIARSLRRYLTTTEWTAPNDSMPPFDYEELLELLSEPATQARLVENVQAFWDPALATDFAAAVGRAWGYLQRELPIRTEVSLASQENVRPGDLDLAKFRRAYSIIERPMLLFEDLEEGSLVGDQVAAFAEVYPSLYGFTVDTLIEGIGRRRMESADYQVPFPREQLLYVLLRSEGVDAELMGKIQAVFADQRGDKPGPPKRSVDVAADQAATPTQRLEGK